MREVRLSRPALKLQRKPEENFMMEAAPIAGPLIVGAAIELFLMIAFRTPRA
jgi:hypothetical protein